MVDPGLDIEQAKRWLMPNYLRFPVEFVRGEGCWLFDSQGRRYIDLLSGISVCNTGHCHPRITEAVQRQVASLVHISNLYYSEPMVKLAARLASSALGGSVYFANSGAEANEAAIKLARKARPGGDIVVLSDAFHGRTYGALSATPQPAKQLPFAPLVPGFKVVDRNSPQQFEAAVDHNTAAVLIEPLQGEAGVNVISDRMLVAAREACDRVGAMLIFDEIQSGMGRTGTLWAYQGTPVVPDVLTAAKALGGGLPIGALITSPKFADVFAPGDHGSTFAGGPVVSAAALAALEIIDQPQLLAEVARLGEYLISRLQGMAKVTAVRGRGLMVAFETELDAPQLVRRALDDGLVINATGPHTIRLLPPLVIDQPTLSQAIDQLEKLLNT